MSRFLLFTLLTSMLMACSGSGHNIKNRTQTAQGIAQHASFSSFTRNGGIFDIQGYKRITHDMQFPTLYIEGDGLAWINRRTLSPNPTPINPLAFKLASLDQSPSVFYLARPCQYVDIQTQPRCNNAYWSDARFASEVIENYQVILNQLKMQHDIQGFHLVGFSGGGAIAALIAAGRNDIASLRTIAGNLDHVALSRDKNVSLLSRSLNPIDIAPRINHIPQIHFSGAEDKVIPPWVARAFANKAGNPACVHAKRIENASHLDGWEKLWPRLQTIRPNCTLSKSNPAQ